MTILVAFGIAIGVGALGAALFGPRCFFRGHQLGRHGIACLRCGEFLSHKR